MNDEEIAWTRNRGGGFIETTIDEKIAALDNIRTFAEAVKDDLKLTPGGYAYEYRGNMNHVEGLKDAIDEYHGLFYRSKVQP